MFCSFRVSSCLVALSLSLVSLAPARPQSSSSALSIVVERYFSAYGKKDLAGVMALWSEKSPNFARYRQSLQQQFTNEELSFGSPTISRVKAEGEKASLRVTIALTSINLKSQQKSEQRLARIFELVKDGGEWKIWRYAPAAEDLAAALVKADTEAERARLLAEEKDLMTAELGRALLAQGQRLSRQGNYAGAGKIYELAMEIAEQLGDKGVMANALHDIGRVRWSLGNYTQALEHFQKSLQISEELSDKEGIARALNSFGVVHVMRGNYAQAREQFQKSLKINEDLGDNSAISRTLNNLGETHRLQGNYAEALELYQQSLKIKEGLGDQAGAAGTQNNIGNVHEMQGNYAEALKLYQQSLKIKEGLGDQVGLASTLNDIGNVHKLQGDYARGLEHFQKSLKIKEEIGDQAGISRTLNNIGSVHDAQGNYAEALKLYQQSLKIKEEIGDRAGISNALGNIAGVHESQGDYAQALEQYQQSLKIYEEIGDQDGIAGTLNNIGVVHNSQGNYTRALEQYQKSLKIKEELGDQDGISRTLNNIGEVHRLQGNYPQALQSAERAAELAIQIGSRELLWKARTNAGEAYFALNQLGQARQSLDQAIATIESLRAQVAGGEQEQQRFFESKISPYHAMVKLLIAQNDPDGALSYAERARARVLLDVLSSGRVSITKTMTGPEIEQERELRSRLVALNTRIRRETQRQQADQDRLNQLDSQLQKARLDLEAFQTSLYAAHPELKPQRGEAQVIRAQEIAALLPDARSVLLEYVVTDDQTYLFAITRAAGKTGVEVRVYTLPIKRAELAEQTERFRQQLAGHDLGFRAPAKRLYQLLLKPAQAQLQGKTNLIIVPDDKLWELPFQALIAEGDRYLIDISAVSYAPSLTVLRELRARHAKPRVDAASLALLALGNPAIGRETVERATLTLRGGKFDPLPTAEQEVKALRLLYGATRSRVYTGPEAREDIVKIEGRQARVLHFATHGILNDSAPMYSYLLLAQGDKNEDGLLEAWELMQLDLKADLAVLSACETARGRFGAGEGVIGLSWAMFVAGVPATLVSQWKVESAGTRDLMLNFHQQLKTPSAAARGTALKAEALRQAALRLMKNPSTSHPFYWAGFVLVSDDR